MSEAAALERARQHCFSLGTADAAESLCVANMAYGLAKIQHVQRELGLPPDATFVGAPDATVTRNVARWKQGFGYGGRIQWSGELAVLDEKPNACGMLVGALSALPSPEQAKEAARRVSREKLVLEGTPLDYDLHESNHFVDVLEAREHEGLPSRYLFIIHSSGHEHRGPTARGPGLYYDESEELRRMARRFETPWGTLDVLIGPVATAWHAFVREVQRFNLARREAFARALFGDFEVIQNATHQGLRAVGDANIGCYVFDDSEADASTLYPLTLSPRLPVYLVRPRRNIDERIADRLGWAERAHQLGVLDRVLRANVLPHGGGYSFPELVAVGRVLELGPDQRAFELERIDGKAPMLVQDVRALPYGYRGPEVLARTIALGLAESVHELEIKYVIST